VQTSPLSPLKGAVAGHDAAQRRGGGVGGEHCHAVGEPGAAADEERVGMASELEQALVICRGSPAGRAGEGIADFAIGGESEIDRNAGEWEGVGHGVGKKGFAFCG
jgi:hypothetical protein